MEDAGAGPIFFAWLMLMFASAGVLEHSGIKVPYFAFFSHDSGKRPQEAPFNMLLAMGLAAALSMSIGVNPRWFYELLPYRDHALTFLAEGLFHPGHILQQLQLLTLAVFAFMMLKWLKLYPPERPGVILDAEWIWRKGIPRLNRALARPLGAPGRAIAAGGRAFLHGVIRLARQVFASDGLAARKVPLTATAVWSAVILGIVVGLALFW
jgi:multicomponent Na+:H+ antiporter subunit D